MALPGRFCSSTRCWTGGGESISAIGSSSTKRQTGSTATGEGEIPEGVVERIPLLLVGRKERAVTPADVTVVVPTLDEREGIGKVLDDLKQEGFDNILVIDGYSRDGTVDIAKSKGALVLQQQGTGKAGALATALDEVQTPYLLVMDGDGTYRAADAHRLLAHAIDHDLVIGGRTNGTENIPFVNRIGNWLISKAFKLLFGTAITDVLSGMYLLRTQKIREVQLTSTSFDVEVEIACAMAANGEITQVPISYQKRLGKQKLRTRDGTRILSTLFWMANYFNPVLLYGAITSLAAIPAAGILLWVLYQRFVVGVWHSGYALFGVMLFLLASQAAAVSLVSLLIKRSEQRLFRQLRKVS